jgi:hypothetical protein
MSAERNPVVDSRHPQRTPSATPKTAVKQLNGSPLSPEEIDGAVLRLMRAAEVTGVGITIFNNGKVGPATRLRRDVAPRKKLNPRQSWPHLLPMIGSL